jgi:hypothetical protein
MLAQLNQYDQNNIDLNASYEKSLKAVNLSPYDYRLWLIHAKVLEDKKDFIPAQKAYEKASLLAPNYFDVFWQWGNFLLRRGQNKEAIVCFKRAIEIYPIRSEYILPLVWDSTKDLAIVESLVTKNEIVEMNFFNLLVSKNASNRAVEIWLKLPQKIQKNAQQSAKALVTQLVESKKYNLAWQIWETLDRNLPKPTTKYKIQNGDFKELIREDGLYFDWSFINIPEAKLSRDSGVSSGSYSLKIDYQAPERASFEHIKQLFLVKPLQKYNLKGSFKASQLTSLSSAKIEIIDPSNNENKVLTSFSIPVGSYNWKPFNLEFNTNAQNEALFLIIRRLDECPKDEPCPIFGAFQVSNIVLEEANQ